MAGSMRKAIVKSAIKNLEEALTAAQMDRARFHQENEWPFSEEQDKFDAEVKESTRVYRETWILGPLSYAIANLKDELERAFPSERSNGNEESEVPDQS